MMKVTTRRSFGRLFSALALAAMLALPAGFAKADGPYKVVATTGMLADLIREIGGEHVAVTGLMGPGVDPHAYRQTRSDIVAMTSADLVVWHGLYLEAQLEEFLLELGASKPVVALGEVVPFDQLLGHDEYDGRFDPHVWMNPRLWQQVTDGAVATLSEYFPAHADDFAAAGDAYKAELNRLAEFAEQSLATIPENQRVLITAHDAFNYFGDAYGFEVLGIQGISTESEAGLRHIEELVDRLVTDQISAVFVESSVSDRNIRALIEGAAAQGHDVVIGGELFSDAMGQEGTYEGTYIGMIDHNTTAITTALGGDVPARGLNDRLGEGS